MAGNKTLDDVIKDNAEDFKKKILKAAEKATRRAVNDINNHALSCIQDYYDEYNPTSYHRSNNLQHAILPTYSVVESGNTIICEAGVEFDALKLYVYTSDEHAYNASAKYNIVDTDWVIINFLEGIHPRTNGSSIPDEVDYIPYTYLPTPDEKMQQQIDEYSAKFDSALYKYFHL